MATSTALTTTYDPPVWLSPQQVAEMTGLSYETILRLVRQGHLPARRAYGRARLRILLSDAEALAERKA
jgi:excisionase family DNA binding protein